MTNPDPVLAIAAICARLSGLDMPDTPSAPPHGHETPIPTPTFIPDDLMARSRVSGQIQIGGEVITLIAGKSAFCLDHELVLRFPDLFTIPANEPELKARPPQEVTCWEDGVRKRVVTVLGLVDDARRRRG